MFAPGVERLMLFVFLVGGFLALKERRTESSLWLSVHNVPQQIRSSHHTHLVPRPKKKEEEADLDDLLRGNLEKSCLFCSC